MAKEFYTAKEVDEILKEAKREMVESINSAITMSSKDPEPTKFIGNGLHAKVLRSERK